jgi:hypothetical protein
MSNVADLMPFSGTIGGRSVVDVLVWYAINKMIKISPVIVGHANKALAAKTYKSQCNRQNEGQVSKRTDGENCKSNVCCKEDNRR